MPKQVTWEQIGQTSGAILSPAYKSNGHVFTAGQVGNDPVTGEFPSSAKEQTKLAIESVEKVLEAAGTTLDRTLKVLLLISDAADAPAVNEVYAQYFTGKPARSCIIVGFPNKAIKVELEVVAEYEEIKQKL